MNKFTKHLRLQLDFTVTIDESTIPTNGVLAHPDRSGDDEAWRESDEHQRRLFKMIVTHKDMLETYLTYLLASELGAMTWQQWQDLLLGAPEDNLEEALRPAIALLDASAQEYFANAKENGTFFECTEEFQESIQSSLDDAIIVDMGDEA